MIEQELLAQALRPKPTVALPAAVAMVQARDAIERAQNGPEWEGVEPPLETQPAEPAPKTGKFGRPIITLKKSRKVVSK